MPRNYVRKKVKPYTKQDLDAALKALKNPGSTIYGVAKQFKIPFETLRGRHTGKHVQDRAGPRAALTQSEEQDIVISLQYMAKAGQPATREYITSLIKAYLNDRGRETRTSM